jgi:dihydroorotate dehydrogenase
MRFLYQRVLKPVLFRFDPELVHDVFVRFGAALGRFELSRRLVSAAYGYRPADASVTVDGITYRRPVLLAAGFDYNGQLTRILPSVAFGGVEVGSITARPSEGNPKPRLTRLVRSRSLLVNKGLRNQGVDRFIERMRKTPREPDFVIGVSIARTNDRESASLEGGIEDYHTTLTRLVDAGLGDFYTINISCPNVFGGESFADADRLEQLLQRLCQVRHDRPMYVKMPINLLWADFEELLEVIAGFPIDGVVIGNLNKHYDELDFPEEAPDRYGGGLSGLPCASRSTELIRRTRARFGDRFTIIGCGGILTAADALEKMRAGADLVQLITGMIFEGPHLMGEICDAVARERTAGRVRRPRTARRWKPVARRPRRALLSDTT